MFFQFFLKIAVPSMSLNQNKKLLATGHKRLPNFAVGLFTRFLNRILIPKPCFPVPRSVSIPRKCYFAVIWTDMDRFGRSFSSNRRFWTKLRSGLMYQISKLIGPPRPNKENPTPCPYILILLTPQGGRGPRTRPPLFCPLH